MEIKPVKTSAKPQYPTIEYYTLNPRLFLKNIPAKWYKNKLIATALAAFVLGGCSDEGDNRQNETYALVHNINKKDNQKTNNQKDKYKVAPIFAHGDGYGATGCVVMSPPVFISEDEARDLIIKRLQEEGIEVDTTKHKNLTFNTLQYAVSCSSPDDFPKIKVNYDIDGQSKNGEFIFEFVSVADVYKFVSEEEAYMCSVAEYNSRLIAQKLREHIIDDNSANAVVFYDPIPTVKWKNNDSWDEMRERGLKETKKLLLAQVDDFIEWLKTENIMQD